MPADALARRRCGRRAALALLAAVLGCGGAGPREHMVDGGGRLGPLHVLAPAAAPVGVAFLFSPAGGWDAESARAARALAGAGLLVAGVDLGEYERRLAASDDGCHYLVSEIEEASKRLQHDESFGHYATPVVAGIGEGGTLAYAALAQSPAATLAGAAAVDPTAVVHTRVPLCAGAAATPAAGGGFRYAPDAPLPGFWLVDASHTGATGSRLAALVRQGLAASPAAAPIVGDLPLVEYPVGHPAPALVVIYSGDGGWRDIDKDIGETLAAGGLPVVGVDSLRYFWNRKSPALVADDLARIVRVYGTRWNTRAVALVGYSFGAGVLPFAVNRLPPDVRARVKQVTLLAAEPRAAFQFTLGGWMGSLPEDARPVLPELLRLDPGLVQCIYGKDEGPDETVCRAPELAGTEVVETSGGHHFDGDYEALARRIADGLRRREGAGATS